MDEHAVAETIGAHLALSSPTAAIWREVALGERSAGDAVAAVLDGRTHVSDEEREGLERARLVFTPVGEARQEARLEALLATRKVEQAVVSLAERSVPQGTRSARGRVLVLVAVAVAIAAVLVLWLLPAEQGAFVGRYTLELSGMTADMRGKEPEPEPQELPSFQLDGRIKVELTPDDDVAGPLEVVGFARGQSGEVLQLSLERVVYPSGKIDVDVPVRAQGLSEGTWELVFAVGRAGEVPRAWEHLGTGGAGYVVVRGEVRIVPKLPRPGA